jgi:hypothetical protein
MEQSFQGKKTPFDLEALLHPSKAFRHPFDVVRDLDMTVSEKRSVLASWASDACAIEANPALRETASGSLVSYDEIIDALQSLDGERSPDTVTYTFRRRQWRRQWTKWKDSGRRSDNGGARLKRLRLKLKASRLTASQLHGGACPRHHQTGRSGQDSTHSATVSGI